ncbi:uncharacterized protein [Ptychodera flava]
MAQTTVLSVFTLLYSILAICHAQHFPVAEGPTQGYPDPLPADGSSYTPTRLPPKRSQSAKRNHLPPKRKCLASLFQNETSIQRTDVARKEDNEIMTIQSATSSVGTQTEHAWISPLDLLAQSSEISRLEQKLQEKDDIINELYSRLSDKNKKTEKQVISNNSKFGVSVKLTQQKKLKGLSSITLDSLMLDLLHYSHFFYHKIQY